jgi:hypothetical protein
MLLMLITLWWLAAVLVVIGQVAAAVLADSVQVQV